MDSFFDQIIYSAANEDSDSERRCLQLNNKDKVLCVTGSGARTLDLLLDSPGEIVSIDFNVTQNHLLELKMAATAELDYRECLEFLGVYSCDDRRQKYQRLKDALTPAAREYWDQHLEAIDQGVIYCGVWESYMRKVKRMMWPRRKLLKKLVTAENLDQQCDVWRKWRTWYWVAAMKPLDWRWIWRTILKEPGIEFVDPDYSISDHLLHSWERAATERLLRTNPYLNLMVGDGYHEDALPSHLQRQNFQILKKKLSRVTIVHQSLLDHLRESPDAYTAFSLSDFSSYASPEVYRQIWEAVIGAASHGAKVCERFFMVHYQPDKLFPEFIERNTQLEDQLYQTDHTFLYTFNCAKIVKNI